MKLHCNYLGGSCAMICALIMAGGKGERFWPLSTDEKPKQFLKLFGEETMIQMTVNRLLDLIPLEQIFVATGQCYGDLIKEQLPNINSKNIILEPVGKNTAPCIALASFIIEKQFPDSTIIVLPADHAIIDEDNFRAVLKSGCDYIDKNSKDIVTIGMKPTRPDIGYGYIQYGDISETIGKNQIREVKKFVEKPDLAKAIAYIKSGNFLWNGGMFIWKSKYILQLTELYLNKTYKILKAIAEAPEKNFYRVLEKKYKTVNSVSVDYAIMEKVKNIKVIPSNFGWDDVGSWYAIERLIEKDENKNVYVGDVKSIESNNNIVFSESKKVILSGINDIFVVENEDLIFIGSKDMIKSIKQIKEMFN